MVPEQPKASHTAARNEGSEKPVRDPRILSWSELLKRVFQIDLTTCPDCGGTLKFIAAIMDPAVVKKILVHLNIPTQPPTFNLPRAPPQETLWDDLE